MSSTVVAFPPEVERVLSLKTVRDAESLAIFHHAVLSAGREEAEFTWERLQELIALLEHFQALLLYDQVEFLRGSGDPAADREFATSIQRLNLEAANGFQRFLRSRAAWATTQEFADEVPRVTGLALDAIHGLMKWGYFLGEPGRSAPWRQLHALYALADGEGTARTPFVLHSGQTSFKPTVQSLYLRTLVLDLLNAGNLSRVQIEVADGWFSSWCQEYTLDTEYVAGRHLFYVDLDSPGGMRLLRGDSPGSTARYVGVEALKLQIEEVQSGLRHGRLYAGYGSGALFPVEEHVTLLATIEKLYRSVLAGAESRIEERTHFEDREVDVVCGAERVLRRVREGAPLAPSGVASSSAVQYVTQTIEITPSGLSVVPAEPVATATTVDFALDADSEIERWRVHDLASRGFGLIIDHTASDGVLLNGLLALLNHETGGWILGSVVRKRPSRVRGEILVGVEVLCYHPIAVELVPASGAAPIQALYLPGGDSSGKHDSLVVREGQFDSGRPVTIRTQEGEFRIRMNRIIRKGADWLNARFEIEGKKA
jgi:hypothetical protein